MARRADGERGAAMVELAICLPFLAVLVFGTLDLGRAFLILEQARNASREGASFASVSPFRGGPGVGCNDPDNIIWHANQESSRTFTILVNNTTPTCGTGPTGTLAPGNPIKVTATTSFTAFTPLAALIIGTNPKVSASTCVNIAGATPNGTACP